MSSPRGGSPGAEHRPQHDTNNPALQNDDSDINDPSATSASEQEADQPSAGTTRAEMEAGNTSVATDHPDVPTRESEDDRLASQVSRLAVQTSASQDTIPADQARHAESTIPPQQHQIANMPPRSTSHMDPLQRPIDLNHSLPPTPREEQPSSEFPSPASRGDRRRSSVMFQEQENSPSVASGSPVPRDHNMERHGSFPASASDSRRSQHPSSSVGHPERGEEPEFVLPRWQPDAEVTYCPICQTQFSIFVRKHHCRKCGRVVCNSCSPHRIIIPHQYIVRPPGYEVLHPPSYLYEGLAGGYMDGYGPAGGERVRLCNPCVPDPQTAPPQSPTGVAGGGSGRSAHQRSRSSFGSGYGSVSSSSRYPGAYVEGRGSEQWRGYSSRTRSITVVPGGRAGSSGSSSRAIHHGSLQRLSQPGSSFPARHSSLAGASSSRNRMLPPTPQIAEEDECPICHRELPSRELPNFEAVREAHINGCIQSHSTYGSPRTPAGDGEGQPGPAPAARRTGMYKYVATEKDCIDDAECTICLEEFTVGVGMARLECLCRFHRSCIAAWFVNHPGRCPVHQHDGFGF